MGQEDGGSSTPPWARPDMAGKPAAVATSLLAKTGDRNRKSLQLMLQQQQRLPDVNNSVLWAAVGTKCANPTSCQQHRCVRYGCDGESLKP